MWILLFQFVSPSIFLCVHMFILYEWDERGEREIQEEGVCVYI